jgi:hypothetical protein
VFHEHLPRDKAARGGDGEYQPEELIMATQVLAETNHAGCISIAFAFFPVGMVYGPGIHATVNLSPAEARKLVEDIQYQLAQLGTAADLGEVVS